MSQRMSTVTVHCPAKTNLTLHVGDPLADSGGRHALDTIYCGIGLFDTVTLERKPGGSGFSLDLEGRHLGDLTDDRTDMRQNLAVKALFLYAQETGTDTDVAIHIIKRIPVAAGLGGGSADAAGVLVGLDAMSERPLGQEALERLAARLGADVPFCVRAGVRRGTGYGQILTDDLGDGGEGIESLVDGDLVIGAYDDGLSTAAVYARHDELSGRSCAPGDLGGETTNGETSCVAASGARIDGARIANDLQRPAIDLHPRSGQAIDLALANGAKTAFVSGSGPTVIAVVDSHDVMLAVEHAWESARAVDRIETARSNATVIVER